MDRRFRSSLQFLVSTLTIALTMTLGSSAFAQADTVVGMGVATYFEDGALSGEEQVSVQTTDESFDYVSDGFLSGSIWLLKAFSENIRFGGSINYMGRYTAEIVPEEELDEDEDPETFEFGTLVELVGRFEYLVPTYDRFDLMFGGVLGVPILFPSGEFRDEIDRLDDEQASVWGLPRVGYLIGPAIAGRWAYSEYLYFRADFLLKWEQIFMFSTTEDVQGVPFSKDWSVSTLRTEFSLGIEVKL